MDSTTSRGRRGGGQRPTRPTGPQNTNRTQGMFSSGSSSSTHGGPRSYTYYLSPALTNEEDIANTFSTSYANIEPSTLESVNTEGGLGNSNRTVRDHHPQEQGAETSSYSTSHGPQNPPPPSELLDYHGQAQFELQHCGPSTSRYLSGQQDNPRGDSSVGVYGRWFEEYTDLESVMKLPMNDPKPEGVQASGTNSGQPSGPSMNNQEPDFSEFLWMEHEEEFDQEVMQELERDEIMQFYEDRFIDEQGGQDDNSDLGDQSLQDQQAADDLLREFSRVLLLNSNSNLNPNAPEFIPNPNAAEFVPGQMRRNDDKPGFSS